MRDFRVIEKAAINVQSSFRGLIGRFKAKQKRLLKFSQSIAEAVPRKYTRYLHPFQRLIDPRRSNLPLPVIPRPFF